MDKLPTPYQQLASQISALFALQPQVEAITVAGSRGQGAGTADSASDIDLCIYTRGQIPLEVRREIVAQSGGASIACLGLNYWGAADEWINAPSGIEIDSTYFDVSWMEEQLLRVIEKHQSAQGYTTCFWYTVRQSIPFYDPNGWFSNMQQLAQAEYPEALRENIIAFNHPLLRGIIPSFANQLEKAVNRRDLVSVNHRTAVLLGSYFDILFAANRQLHPGEKRLVEFALNHCRVLPTHFEADLAAVLLQTPESLSALPAQVHTLLNHLDEMLKSELGAEKMLELNQLFKS